MHLVYGHLLGLGQLADGENVGGVHGFKNILNMIRIM